MKRFLTICSLLAIGACAQQPPPPPVVANPPPPPPPPTFTVYFDYNSSLLGPGAREILKLAANAYTAGSPATVQVTGYADPSGSAGYNKKLSLKRASVVAATLVQDGVPRSSLSVSGDGETNSGPTPGQDRRVEVVLGAAPPPGS
jgi:OmpA-OmpF porin, OOP family